MRKKIILLNYFKLIITSVLVGLFATLLADSLKRITAYYEAHILEKAGHFPLLLILLPTVGITMIYFLRKHLFKGKQNKGIKEIYQSMGNRRNELPPFKIPSNYFNGFLTVIFGGSTCVEVSTVVATAAIGAVAHKKKASAHLYKTELICAGTAAGIATLFCSPLAGLLFAIEVIARKFNKTILISGVSAVLVSWLFIHFFSEGKLFDFTITNWHMYALPYFFILSILAGFISVYFTRITIIIKDRFAKINNNFIKVNTGAIIVGFCIFCFPQLYGDSYHSIPALINKIGLQPFSYTLAFILLAIVILKPFVASLTLGAGGDGGVFAPSIVAGAILGMLIAVVLNHYFHTHLIVINFALVGAAAVLSAAIYAPFTALFLTCGIAVGGYSLFVPILIGCFVAKYFAQFICGYTVYSYKGKKV